MKKTRAAALSAATAAPALEYEHYGKVEAPGGFSERAGNLALVAKYSF